MFKKKSKPHLLVVGGTGFIGYHLALSAKKRGWKVTSMSINRPKKYRYVDGVNYLRIDINNLKELKKKLIGSFNYVVNLGGYVDHTSFENDGDKIIKAHFIGVINLTVNFESSPGITISVPFGSSTSPVTSVVLK